MSAKSKTASPAVYSSPTPTDYHDALKLMEGAARAIAEGQYGDGCHRYVSTMIDVAANLAGMDAVAIHDAIVERAAYLSAARHHEMLSWFASTIPSDIRAHSRDACHRIGESGCWARVMCVIGGPHIWENLP
jgi:hypothetical protein